MNLLFIFIVLEDLHPKEFLNSNTVYYPICPLGDTDNIIQIKNNIALASEGRAMHHCVAGYGSSLLEEKSYIYKVINPERGTLHISRNGDNFDINQFKLVCNGPPSNDSYKIIRQWLKQKERQ
ncbi:PcfJ domain-containing protein [sulfur-oxidizing endosymbiont of Gigantopelta aegis]|uniref:PcfJ domain-containing protein n=1 Tax=sulfur-oxidizing endosymbiont of Gigantopelta aegis TaxID=2794934 RepID=UPI001BE4DCE2|nr:PcfJ domain-containing protein [sulfur-oxidizing endosymbiont of Gigantopelta aegis]